MVCLKISPPYIIIWFHFSLGAIPITGVLFGSSNTVPVSASAPECVGSEASLLECQVRQGSGTVLSTLGETGRYQNDGQDSSVPVGVRCEGKLALAQLVVCTCV